MQKAQKTVRKRNSVRKIKTTRRRERQENDEKKIAKGKSENKYRKEQYR